MGSGSQAEKQLTKRKVKKCPQTMSSLLTPPAAPFL